MCSIHHRFWKQHNTQRNNIIFPYVCSILYLPLFFDDRLKRIFITISNYRILYANSRFVQNSNCTTFPCNGANDQSRLMLFFISLFIIANIIIPKVRVKWVVNISSAIILLTFVLHSIGLIIRWYISEHAPWSNGYESMIYIGWATILAGFIFVKKSPITLAATAILTFLILYVAHMSWMDPQITNLVPVLKSYWLTIHVSVITASYGFLALGALLGFFNLILMIMKTPKNHLLMVNHIKELTTINERTLTVGLYMLAIGTFIGGVWANESWGRYWGWDPKETWALVSILVYSFILHMRFIPGLKSRFTFNLASIIGFFSILMTYFGVNYYLSGLHSYASGAPVPIPNFVYYMLGVLAITVILAYNNELRLKERQK